MNHIFGCPMHYGVGAPGLINSLDYLQSFCPELDIDILPGNYQTGREPEQSEHLNSVIASCSPKLLNLDIMHYAKVNHHFTLPAITVRHRKCLCRPEHIAKILV